MQKNEPTDHSTKQANKQQKQTDMVLHAHTTSTWVWGFSSCPSACAMSNFRVDGSRYSDARSASCRSPHPNPQQKQRSTSSCSMIGGQLLHRECTINTVLQQSITALTGLLRHQPGAIKSKYTETPYCRYTAPYNTNKPLKGYFRTVVQTWREYGVKPMPS